MNKVKGKSAGRKASSGNVTIDLGETIEKKLRAATMASGASAGKPGLRGYRAGILSGHRSGTVGNYRPWYSRVGRPWLGQNSYSLIPAAIANVKTTEVLTGLGLGIVGNRAVARLTPMLWPGQSPLLHEGIAFVAGLLPVLIQKNATTVGVAIPGGVMLGASLVDALFNWAFPASVGVPGAVVPPPAGGMQGNSAMAARQKLASIQARMAQQAPVQQQQQPLPRVVAQRQFA